MRKVLVFACLLWSPALFAQEPDASRQALRASVDKALSASALKKTKAGIYIQNLRTGDVLYEQNAQDLFVPASNTKLISTAAALYHLGPEYRFRTLFAVAKDARKGSKVSGDLYVKGFGDPSILAKDLLDVAQQLSMRGLKEITGDLVIDSSFFDDQISPPGFDDKPKVESTYRGVVGATSVNNNVVSLRVFPGASGQKARALSDPAGAYLELEVEATTAKKTRLSVDCDELKEQRLKCSVKGSIDEDNEDGATFRRRAIHPDALFGYSLRAALKSQGITVKGKIKSGSLPKDAKTLYIHTSDELSTIVRSINKSSNNFMAEMLLKTLGAEYKGAPGTSEHGIDAVADYLQSIGIEKGSYNISNASGLWGSTQFSPAQMVKLLGAAYKDSRMSADFVSSLAISSADGTLRYRMKGTSAARAFRGKTGTLDGVICLSGYLRLNNQEVIGVSLLFNAVSNSRAVKTAQSQINVAIAEYLLALDPSASWPILQDSEENSEEGDEE